MSCPRKVVGHCTKCGSVIADVVTQFPYDHPFSGDPIRLGAWHENARRATMILSNGSTMDITVCSECVPDLGVFLPSIWRAVLKAFANEMTPEYRQVMNMTPYSESQVGITDRWLAGMVDVIPLGILFARDWKECNG